MVQVIGMLASLWRRDKGELNKLGILKDQLAKAPERYAGARILSAKDTRKIMPHYSVEHDIIMIEGVGGAKIKWLGDAEAIQGHILPPAGLGYYIARENTYYFLSSDKKHFMGAVASLVATSSVVV